MLFLIFLLGKSSVKRRGAERQAMGRLCAVNSKPCTKTMPRGGSKKSVWYA